MQPKKYEKWIKDYSGDWTKEELIQDIKDIKQSIGEKRDICRIEGSMYDGDGFWDMTDAEQRRYDAAYDERDRLKKLLKKRKKQLKDLMKDKTKYCSKCGNKIKKG